MRLTKDERRLRAVAYVALGACLDKTVASGDPDERPFHVSPVTIDTADPGWIEMLDMLVEAMMTFPFEEYVVLGYVAGQTSYRATEESAAVTAVQLEGTRVRIEIGYR